MIQQLPTASVRLSDPETLQDPYEALASLRADAPVAWLPDLGVVAVTANSLVHDAIFRTGDLSNNLAAATDGIAFGSAEVLATTDPPLHTIHRQVVGPIVAANSVSRFEPVVRELTDEHLDGFIDNDGGEWMAAYACSLPARVVAEVIGLPPDLTPIYAQMGRAGGQLIGELPLMSTDERARWIAEVGPGLEQNMAWSSDLITEAARMPRDDVVSSLARATNDGLLSVHEAATMVGMFIGAATDSTTSMLGSAVRVLAEQPEVQAALRADPQAIPAFVEEVVRLESPFRCHFRSALVDVDLGGANIPVGSRVLLSWAAANRDPEVYDHPDSVDLSRPHPRRHLGFGWGIHLCVGAPLARLEGRITIERLLARTNDFTISGPARYLPSIAMRRLQALPLALEPS